MLLKLLVICGLFGFGMQVAYAGVDDWAPIRWSKNVVSYVIDQPDCAWTFVKGAVTPHNSVRGDLWDWVACHGNAANRVPTTLTPIIQ